ncbi:MAG: DUF5998 family protein, partial [Propionibacteriaceae bacterium]
MNEWDALAGAVDGCGYFPELVKDSLKLSLVDEELVSWFVQQEAIVARDSIQRHMSALALTPSRLLVCHVDETDQPGPSGRPIARGQAAATTESVPLSSINAVALTRVIDNPAAFTAGAPVGETWLTLGWGVLRQLDLEPASCADPNCSADHGYSGQ